MGIKKQIQTETTKPQPQNTESVSKTRELRLAKGSEGVLKRSDVRNNQAAPASGHAAGEKCPSKSGQTKEGPSPSFIPMPRMLPPGSPEVWASARAAPHGSVQASIFARRLVTDTSEKATDVSGATQCAPPKALICLNDVNRSMQHQSDASSSARGRSEDKAVSGPIDAKDPESTPQSRASSVRPRRKPLKHEADSLGSAELPSSGPRCGEAVGAAPHRPCRQGKQRRNRRYGTRDPATAAVCEAPAFEVPPVLAVGPSLTNLPTLILNCEDIGRSAARCPFYRNMHLDFIWQAVGQAITYYEKRGCILHNVCRSATTQRWPAPANIDGKLIKCPVIDECPEPDRHFVLRLAQTYKCPVVDNWNYRGKEAFPKDAKKIEYIIDAEGTFVPLWTP